MIGISKLITHKSEVPLYTKAFRWWITYLVAGLFFPPIPLSFTATASEISPALLIAVAYLVWRPLQGRVRTTFTRSLSYWTPMILVAYMSAHSFFFLATGKMSVFLVEAQWVVYFLALIVMTIDMSASPEFLSKLQRTFLALVLLEGGVAIVTSFIGPLPAYSYGVLGFEPRFGLQVYRALGTFQSANGLAGFLAVAALMAWSATKEDLPTKRWILVLTLFAALLLTQSKSGMLAFAVGLGVVLLMNFLGKPSLRHLGQLYVYVIGGGLAYLLYNKSVLGELSSDYVGRVSFTADVFLRFLDADAVIKLFGFGFRQTAYVNPDTQGWVTAHNSYISFLAEIGLFGFGALLIVWILSLSGFWRARSWGWLGGFVAMLCHLYTEGFLYSHFYVLLSVMFFVVARTGALMPLAHPSPKCGAPVGSS